MSTNSNRTNLALSERDGWVLIPVRVQPRASRQAIVGVHDGALKVSLTAPPVDGAANQALVALLAQKLGIARSSVRLIRGETGREKLVAVRGVSMDRVHALVAQE